MNILKGTQLVYDFIKALNTYKGIRVNRSVISRNVFEFHCQVNCLLYVKGRAEKPYRWGVTANVVDRLQAKKLRWYVILLFESFEKGYLLTSNDVEHYIQHVWPLGADGDYKPANGSYLSRSSPIYGIQAFVDAIENI